MGKEQKRDHALFCKNVTTTTTECLFPRGLTRGASSAREVVCVGAALCFGMCSHLGRGVCRERAADSCATPCWYLQSGPLAGAVKLPGLFFPTPPSFGREKGMGGKVCKDLGTWNGGWVTPEGNWTENQ